MNWLKSKAILTASIPVIKLEIDVGKSFFDGNFAFGSLPYIQSMCYEN